MRINKCLSELGLCSRREADRWIAEGRVRLNGETAEMGQQVEEKDCLELDGKLVKKAGKAVRAQAPRRVLLACYKPRGVVCSCSDKDRAKNIVELVSYPERVYPIGRLDKDSEGLILLTNQGELVNRINRGGRNEKEYVVTVDKPLTREALDRLADGVELSELNQKTRPCEVWQDLRLPPGRRQRQFHIVLSQGLNRKIRRMCEALGYEVKRLKRVRILSLRLEGLRPGEFREIGLSELGLSEELWPE